MMVLPSNPHSQWITYLFNSQKDSEKTREKRRKKSDPRRNAYLFFSKCGTDGCCSVSSVTDISVGSIKWILGRLVSIPQFSSPACISLLVPSVSLKLNWLEYKEIERFILKKTIKALFGQNRTGRYMVVSSEAYKWFISCNWFIRFIWFIRFSFS